MLVILDINPTGHFGFGIHKTIEVNELGVTLLEGKNYDRGGSANGAGKTSLFNTITTIIFDKNPTEWTGEAIVNEILGKSFGKITFLDGAGDKWRIITTRKWRKSDKYPCDGVIKDPSEWHNRKERYSGTDVYLEKWDGSMWRDERATNTVAGDTRLDLKATRKKILQVVGMSYEQFMNVAYLAQQQSLKFVNGTHKEKLEVISELSDISVWDKRQSKVKEQIKQVDSEIERSKSTLEGAAQAGLVVEAPRPQERQAIESSIDAMKLWIEKCDTGLSLASSARSNWLRACQDVDSAISLNKQESRDLLSQKKPVEEQLSELARKYAEDCAEIRHRPQPADVDDMQDEIGVLRGQIQMRRGDLEDLMTGSGKCPRCRSFVSDDHLIRQREILTLEIKESEDGVKTTGERIAAATLELETQIQKDLEVKQVEYQIKRADLQSILDFIDLTVAGSSQKIEQLQDDKRALGPDPHHAIAAATNDRMNWVASLSREEHRLQEHDDKLNKWNQYRKMLDDARSNIDRQEDEIKYLRAIERAFGDKGIKAHKLSVILSMLNKTVQDFADILTDGSVKVWVTPFREKADGSIATDMQIMVQEGEKRNTPFGLYSGGEKQQIVLAFIGAFWQVASTQGSGVNILCLDEIFSALDELNAVGVFHYIDHMKAQGKSTIMVVTHDKNIKNQLKFDRQWLVKKSGHISQLITDTSTIIENEED